MILLTGGAGFIGSHTAVELLNAGFDIVIADDFSNSRRDVIEAIKQITRRKFPVYDINVADCIAVERVFSENKIDGVIHFAGYKSVAESVAEPVKYYRNNIDTTLTLLEAMSAHGVHRFVFSSSATVYGTPASVPIAEDAPVGACANPYGRTKYFIEQILADVARADSDISIVLLRYFNPIGAHESGLIGELPNGIPNNLMPYITQTVSGRLEKLKVFGSDYPTHDGTGVRDYIHVVDLAKGHIAAMRYAFKHNGIEVFNLGTGSGSSVLDVINAFERSTGMKVPYELAPRRSGDVPECWASTAKANGILGWWAEKNLDDMCRDAWRWQKHIDGVEREKETHKPIHIFRDR